MGHLWGMEVKTEKELHLQSDGLIRISVLWRDQNVAGPEANYLTLLVPALQNTHSSSTSARELVTNRKKLFRTHN